MKVFCAVLNNRLSDYLETNNLLVEEQNGFWHDRSCQDHLFTVYNLVESRKLSSLQTFVCFIDFRKAFDSINRDLLWKKLEHNFNIKGRFLNILKTMYENVSNCVRVNDDVSDWFSINSGVKQGCVLSPTLFDMFINDLMQDIQALNTGID